MAGRCRAIRSRRMAARPPVCAKGMATILILVGTESGNAQMVADALQPVLTAAGHTVDVTDKAANFADLEAHDVLLVVCATHGSGDIPTNILPLVETLERDKSDLSGHRYGVIALGDMTYQDTFCGGGKYRASNLDWHLFSYMIFYMFQCHSPKCSHPLPLP